MNANRSTIRTIEILHLIAESSQQLTITEISQALSIPKSTTHQIVQTLVDLKMLETGRAKTFRLGIHFFELALPAFARMDLRREGQPILDNLSHATGESVFMATYDDDEIVYLDQVMGPSLMRLSVNPGSRGPIHSTALGKAILAALDDKRVQEITGGGSLQAHTDFTIQTHEQLMEDLKSARARGYAVDDRELLPDICCGRRPGDRLRRPAGGGHQRGRPLLPDERRPHRKVRTDGQRRGLKPVPPPWLPGQGSV